MTVTKAALINKVNSSNHTVPKAKAKEALETILRIIKASHENGEDVLISGFGKFHVKLKSARKGRNPLTGESLMLDPRRVVVFNPSGNFRKAVNNK